MSLAPTTQTATTPRASIGMPAERVEQIRRLAEGRGISTVALIESWIQRDIAEGAPGATSLPGYSATRDDDIIAVQIAGRWLPMMKAQQAMLLSAVLDGAADTPNPALKFSLPTGRGIPLKLDGAVLKVGRHGRGVVFSLETEAAGSIEKWAAPSSYVAELAAAIRTAVSGN
jgi:hypothetical protein